MTKTAKKPGKPKEKRKYVRKPKVYPPEALELPPGGELGLSEDELLAELCRESFFEFVKAFWPTIIAEKPVWNWHIEFLCGELQEVAERVFAGLPRKHDLVVNVSPGTTKSTLISVMLPAWIWTRMPSARIISATYAYTLATDFSRKSKDVITSELYRRLFPDVKIRDDQKAKNNYVNTHGGERFATGVAGVILGKHAHFIIVDDPITPTQSCSDLELANANRWMEETLPSRMVDKALTPTILVMQRLHENDPTGSRLEKADRSPVRHVCLPAELTEDVKPEGCRARYVDGLFDPVRLSHETLSGIEARQGEFVLCSQYLQKPIPRGTAMFLTDKIRVEQPPPKFRRLVRAWDKACLIAGTLVRTSAGHVPIEDVRAGDTVLTRKGYRKVKWAGVTKQVFDLVKVTLADGRVLEGTADHRVRTENRGWVTLGRLVGSCYSLKQLPTEDGTWASSALGSGRLRSFGLTGLITRRTLANTTTSLGVKTPAQAGGGTTLCTEPSTASTKVKYLPDMTCITLTGTRKTTTRATSKSSPGRTTAGTTTLSPNGTRRKKPSVFARPITRKSSPLWPLKNRSRRSAKAARGNFLPGILTPNVLSGAAGGVDIKRVRKPDRLINEGGCLVQVRTVEWRKATAPVPVYDLEVDGKHEFFANGVLAHNCTSQGGAFTVGTKMGEDFNGRLWVLDVVRVQVDTGRREALILATARADGKKVRVGIEEEPGSGGKHSALVTVKNLAGFSVVTFKVGRSDGDKETRAYALSSQVNVGNVSMAPADWNKAFVHELRFFPRSKYKDQVDSSSLAANMLSGKRVKIGALSKS